MKKKFKRKNKRIQFFVLSVCGLFSYFIYGKVVMPQNFFSQGVIYIAISMIILVMIFITLLYALLDLNRKITASDTTIIVKKPFKTIELKWRDIIEFKKYEKGFGVWAGWKYSLKYNRRGEQQIIFADNNIENLQALINLIFRLAVTAKFIEIRNESFLPFSKNYKSSDWKNG